MVFAPNVYRRSARLPLSFHRLRFARGEHSHDNDNNTHDFEEPLSSFILGCRNLPVIRSHRGELPNDGNDDERGGSQSCNYKFLWIAVVQWRPRKCNFLCRRQSRRFVQCMRINILFTHACIRPTIHSSISLTLKVKWWWERWRILIEFTMHARFTCVHVCVFCTK